ncbi:hypothetical protein RvY_15286 [Ramazzottius varieornatus]|uniref:FLYWCH-type domain-containing protein n=1 Tax=Ramazzottius varieornatus TaxID=947166 RepID=A0A1D1W2G3_RAMVA|nr:hypothetical protein RvY_15286 [Ramazzottius varieornatus]
MVAPGETASVSVPSNSPTLVKFIKSSRGGNFAVFGSYTYTKNRNLPHDRTYWNCGKKESHGCKGTITLDCSNSVVSSAEHNHVPNVNEAKAEDIKASLRERARKSLTKPRRLLSDLVQSMPTEVAGYLPSANTPTRPALVSDCFDLPT